MVHDETFRESYCNKKRLDSMKWIVPGEIWCYKNPKHLKQFPSYPVPSRQDTWRSSCVSVIALPMWGTFDFTGDAWQQGPIFMDRNLKSIFLLANPHKTAVIIWVCFGFRWQTRNQALDYAAKVLVVWTFGSGATLPRHGQHPSGNPLLKGTDSLCHGAPQLGQ